MQLRRPTPPNAEAASPSTSTPTYGYPGGHALDSSNLFLSIYDEEEYYERLAQDELEYSISPSCFSHTASDPNPDFDSCSKPTSSGTGLDIEMEDSDTRDLNENLMGVDMGRRIHAQTLTSGSEDRHRTIFHVLRLFDSIRGFHKVCIYPSSLSSLGPHHTAFVCIFIGISGLVWASPRGK